MSSSLLIKGLDGAVNGYALVSGGRLYIRISGLGKGMNARIGHGEKEMSAQIDGAGYITRYLRVVMPLSKPILATLMIFSAVGHWNSFMDSILYIRDLKLYTMSARLRMVLNEAAQLANEIKAGTADDGAYLQITPMSVRFTIAAITTIPVLCIYPFFQKYFTGGIMIGAVKG